MGQTVKALHKSREKLWNASMASHEKYIEERTGLFKEQFVELRNCPVCSSEKHQTLFSKAGGTYVKCTECMMIFLNPVFSDGALMEYYENNHSVQAELVEDGDPFYEKLYTRGLDSIEHMTAPGNLLDVGCSSGVFLDLAKRRSWKTYGIELNVQEYKMAVEKGHQVYNELLENMQFDCVFDAITLWDVFEHMKDGRFYLGKMKSLLSDNGVIFMQIPSSDSLAAKILQEKCNMFDGLEHVNLYGVNTIEKLANQCGMSVLELHTVISEIGVINNYLSFQDPYRGDTQNREFIPGLIDEAGVLSKQMGYKIQVVIGESR